MCKYIGYSYGIKFGRLWIHLWGKRRAIHPTSFAKATNGFHAVSYLKMVDHA